MPARHRAVVGVGIVPEADLVHVFPGGERGARRHAHRAGGVRRAEHRAARRERVEVRRLHDRMSRRAHDLRVVLVGHDDEKVGGFHCFCAAFWVADRHCALHVELSRFSMQRSAWSMPSFPQRVAAFFSEQAFVTCAASELHISATALSCCSHCASIPSARMEGVCVCAVTAKHMANAPN